MKLDKVLSDLLDITTSRGDNWRQLCCQYPDGSTKPSTSSDTTPVGLTIYHLFTFLDRLLLIWIKSNQTFPVD